MVIIIMMMIMIKIVIMIKPFIGDIIVICGVWALIPCNEMIFVQHSAIKLLESLTSDTRECLLGRTEWFVWLWPWTCKYTMKDKIVDTPLESYLILLCYSTIQVKLTQVKKKLHRKERNIVIQNLSQPKK